MKKKNVLMINPLASPKMAYDGPPLSLLSVVSMLDEKKYNIHIVDWHDKDYEKKIRELSRASDICGITCMTGYQILTMLQAAKIVKQENPNINLICGGAHPTLMPEQTLNNSLIDIVVIGQGQRAFAELVEALSKKRDISKIKGLGFKKNGKKVFTEERKNEDINNFPILPYHLLENFENYLVETSFAKKTLYYLTSAGCTGNCKFCGEESLHHRKWNCLSIQRVIDDIKMLKQKYNFEGVAITDSNFYVNEKRVAEFCRKMIPLKLKWGCTSGRPDQLKRYSDETLSLMQQSGLNDIFLGVEAADNKTLELMSKGCTIQDSLEILPRLKKYGIRAQCSFIIGVPGVDVRKDFKSTMQLINKLRRDKLASQFHLFVYTPLPGTKFLEEASRLGYKIPETLEGWTHYEFHAHTTPWIPKKYAQFTDAASIYFMFLAGHAQKVVKSVVPKYLLLPALITERFMYLISKFRISASCFLLPVDYYLIKWVIMHKNKLFRGKKLLF